MSKPCGRRGRSSGRFTPSFRAKAKEFADVADDAGTIAVMFDEDAGVFRHVGGSLMVPGVVEGGCLDLDQLPPPSLAFTVGTDEHDELVIVSYRGKDPSGPPEVIFMSHYAFHLAMS